MVLLTDKQTEAMNALASGEYTFILYGGAIGGGKTILWLSALLVMCEIFRGSRWCVVRENIERIRTTTIPSFNWLKPTGTLKSNPYEYTHPNGSVILFKGENYAADKSHDWMKGLEVNGFLFEEINECQKSSLYMAFQRAGRWKIDPMPPPTILATCNPSFAWVKTEVYDKHKSNTLPKGWLYIPAKITDNPHLTEAYKENLKNLSRFEYEVMVEGNWDIQLKTGNEFLRSFELEKHIGYHSLDNKKSVHVSIDSNTYPYIAITVWQLEKYKDVWYVRQVHELPGKDPYNTARKASEQLANWLIYSEYKQKVFLYGYKTTKNRNNIDDDKRSFCDIFIDALKKKGFSVENRMLNAAPPVNNFADFVNEILDQT